MVASGCGGTNVTPTPSSTPTTAPPPSATAAPTAGATTPSPSPAAISLYLRSWTRHASIGPVNSFGNVPLVIANGELLSVNDQGTAGPVPLFTSPQRRSVSQAALRTILAEAETDGLLGEATSFVCPPAENGGVVVGGPGPTFLELVVNGVTYELSATCESAQPSVTPGTPAPATWAAFRRFTTLLSDASSWLGAEIGPAVAYDPDRLAVLVIPVDPSPATPNPADVVPWPLAGRFDSFGVAYAWGRCAVVSGPHTAALLAAVRPASADTVFRDGRGALAQLIVRTFMPGEPDPCG
jgi:hypothetical protein